VKQGEDRWNEHQRGDCGEQQSTDDGAAKRCVLLTAVAKTQ
jgi:hypothetical protein